MPDDQPLDVYDIEALKVCTQQGLVKREDGYSLLRGGQHTAIPQTRIDKLKSLGLIVDPKGLGSCQATQKASDWLKRKGMAR